MDESSMADLVQNGLRGNVRYMSRPKSEDVEYSPVFEGRIAKNQLIRL